MIKAFPYKIIFLFALMLAGGAGLAQTDTTERLLPLDTVLKKADTQFSSEKKVDSVLAVHSPRKAAFRSAVLPGWGQAYNKRYWKIPIVYGALGVTGYVFVYNLQTYRELRLAYKGKVFAARGDSTFFWQMNPRYRAEGYTAEDIRYYRDEFRRNIDYSAVIFLIFWGLNVVDAAVDAHLKSFDVSPDLSFRFKAGYSDLAQTNGVSLVLTFK